MSSKGDTDTGVSSGPLSGLRVFGVRLGSNNRQDSRETTSESR